MRAKAFTLDEHNRIYEKTHDMSQAYMWTRNLSFKEKAAMIGRYSALIGIPLIGVVAIIAILISFILSLSAIVAVMSCVIALVISLALAMIGSVITGEKDKISPPVFVFYHDKLFYFQKDEDFHIDSIKKIPPPEIIALREASPSFTTKMTNRQIEGECYYLSAIKQFELGNDSAGLIITAIEDIVDVDIDEDNTSRFIIEYEDRYGDEIRLSLSLSEWGELYEWLYSQLFD